MYYLLSLLIGVLITGQLALNGGLTTLYGAYTAVIIVHVMGLLATSFLVLIRRERPFARRMALPLYLGGAIGVGTTVANNLAFGRISVSAILALGLLGQSILGMAVDHYGLMGMPKFAFQKQKIIGLALIFGGIAVMTDHFEFWAVLLSLLAGAAIVISRTLNAKLADATSVRVGTFYIYLVGLSVAIPVCLLLGGRELSLSSFSVSPRWYLYFGGVFGASLNLLCNKIVTKMSAFYLSLFSFLGQVSSGILIDALIDHAFSLRNLAGGVFVTAGLCVNLLLDRRAKIKNEV